MDRQKLIKRKKSLKAVMIVPIILLIVFVIYIFLYDGEQDLTALIVMLPLVALAGIFFPFIQLMRINKELKGDRD